MKDSSLDPRQQAILDSAWQAFATYGFRKTSMDDIARGAGMSRPALYLVYRNKEDIFRSLVAQYYSEAAQEVARALADAPGPAQAVATAFATQGGAAIEVMLGSPHGLELLDLGNSVAGDIVADGEAQLQKVYAAWLGEQGAQGRITLPAAPERVAETLCAALKGIKTTAPDVAAYRQRIGLLAQLVGGGLSRVD